MRADELMKHLISGELTNYSISLQDHGRSGEVRTLALHLEMLRIGLFVAPLLPLVAASLASLHSAHIDSAKVSNVLRISLAYRRPTGTGNWLHRAVDWVVQKIKASGRR
jgi:hypothetical protein